MMTLDITSAKQTCGRKLSQRVEEEKKQRKKQTYLDLTGAAIHKNKRYSAVNS